MGKNRHFQALFCTKYPLKPPKKRYFFGHEINFMTKIREKSCAELCRNRRTPHNFCTPAALSSTPWKVGITIGDGSRCAAQLHLLCFFMY